jgi:release factor glutamine methyltransferase
VFEHEQLPPELDHEPDIALYGNGHTRAIAEHARDVLVGPLVLEVHSEQADAVAELLRALGYADVRISRDLAGRERIVEGRWER